MKKIKSLKTRMNPVAFIKVKYLPMSSNVTEDTESTTSLSIVLANEYSTVCNIVGRGLFAPELVAGRALAQQKKPRL